MRIADGPPSLLGAVAYKAGELTGDFYGRLNTHYAVDKPDLSLKLVRDGDALVGQLIAYAHNAERLYMLPSFVRLRREAVSEAAKPAE